VESNQIEKWRCTISSSSDKQSISDAVLKNKKGAFMWSLKEGKNGSHDVTKVSENMVGKWKLGETIGKGFTGLVKEGWIPPSDIRVSPFFFPLTLHVTLMFPLVSMQ
jgi:hypothetical protein